uniref:NADH-ubiquinone oxidoreductase chain 3 n=1 Tax=Gnathotrichus materiarius TaxID=1220286 RepID=A0A343A6M9_9CUCU|nr:NADH dehydrogenase subunit 3 [Gnathotrichus materiarius]AOY40234.1 NADH dehydrogenase subunit 3 [Gnathotrichus materiarius]
MIILSATMASLIGMVMILLLNMVSKKTFHDREKMSAFECGFDPKNSARMPFSLQFFLIAIIFVIFDVELTLFLPLILIMKTTNIMTLSSVTTSFIMILLFGIYHESKQGALDWMK